MSATDLGYHRRKTYRAVLSEPKIVFPANSDQAESSNPTENPVLLLQVGLKFKNVGEKKAGIQERKTEDKTKWVSRPLFDVYCIYW